MQKLPFFSSKASFEGSLLFHRILLLAFISLLANHHASAENCSWPVVQAGWFSAKQGKSQHIDIEGLIGDDFSVSKSSDNNVIIGLGYYFQGLALSPVSIFYGLNAFYLAPTKVMGNVTEENLFTNLSYHYYRTHYPIYVAAKGIIPCGQCFDIVIDVGIGPNIGRTKGFKEHSLDDGITIGDRHLFKGKTNVAFSAMAGLGCRIDKGLRGFILEIDYRFFYLGQGSLKKISSQLKNRLSTGQSYANAIFFSISL